MADRLDSREVIHKRLRKTFKDERLRQVAAHPFVADGHDLRNVPAWAGLVSYLEQQFGAWTVTGGMGRLTEALVARMATRGVTVATGVEVTDLVVRSRAGSSGPPPGRGPWTPTWWCARSTRAGCPRSRRTSSARCPRCRR